MAMKKVLPCKEIVPDCPAEVSGTSDDEVMRLAAEHARTAHGLREVDAQTAEKMRESIRTSG